MSEIVKPRQFTVYRDKIKTGENNYEVVQIADGFIVKKDERVKVIELATTIKMMDEMADVMNEAIDLMDDSSRGFYKCDSFSSQSLKLSIESYKTFKSENGLDD